MASFRDTHLRLAKKRLRQLLVYMVAHLGVGAHIHVHLIQVASKVFQVTVALPVRIWQSLISLITPMKV